VLRWEWRGLRGLGNVHRPIGGGGQSRIIIREEKKKIQPTQHKKGGGWEKVGAVLNLLAPGRKKRKTKRGGVQKTRRKELKQN